MQNAVDTLTLTPVIALSDAFFAWLADQGAVGKSGPEKRPALWRSFLESTGLGKLQKSALEPFFVPAGELGEDEIGRILALSERHRPSGLPVLQGAFVLRSGDQILIRPSAFTDFRSLESWRRAVGLRPQNWERLDIGYPWVHCRVEGERLVFSDYGDGELPATESQAMAEVSLAELEEALRLAGEELNAFSARCLKALGRLQPELAWDQTYARFLYP